ncbi:molecular chaperone HtpG [Anaerotignum lactatifermentans]|uniref:Molecular chaperone HtpG n=1 Tax=Anaerotignum lactatifermentans TaxID=160404 RepID=A0ABS2GAX1_9FIRM|nr:molecular chaperone HtpG [Anaerotignum lactatifermentans]MBM6830032.1 molecular chaperone HtpG [Anaerotignum lactatifermentans]MBM6878624.1 molecular chaperone HtpG [Anaerotignum lactatifermentans]MBM6951663.1 molecular chaperone HtpG [Anaerotignum lactatifermentans]
MKETGNLSINSENFLPIIKKWLYTDKDIFIRELVSNACDAVTKLKKLMLMGEADHIPAEEAFQVRVLLNKDEKTLQIVDNGIGMTDEEIKKYINQIAFSGAADFLAKYEEKAEGDNEIIGHFGLGFYSAFMVANKVEIDTLSYQQGAAAAKWSCADGIDYEMSDGSRTERGTTITLYLSEDGEEFLDETKLYAALHKYCAFMPVPIFVDILSKEDEAEETPAEKDNTIHISEEEAASLTKEEILAKAQEKTEKTEEEKEEPKPLNDPSPLWLKQPRDCTEEEYKEFYHKVFFDLNDPLFWIHLNMDYPFRLKGILYFPKLVEQMDVVEGQIKLYSNQVYIADNIREVVPEFLLLLKGVLDCPDMPLNVSRSALQNDGYVEKMNSYITKKVADKLNQLFKSDRSAYEGFWDDIGMFFKYGCMREESLYDKIKDALLLKTTDGVYETIAEYLEKNKEKHENKIFFVTDEAQQAQYIRMFKEQGLEAAILTSPVDKPFVSFLEYKNPGVKVQRIDADITDTLQEKKDGEESEAKKQADEYANTKMETLFREALSKEDLKVKAEHLKTASVSAMILLSEDSRRMMEMMEAYGNNEMYKAMFANVKPDETLVLNKSNKLVQFLMDAADQEEKKEDCQMICRQVYDLALMSHRSLTSEEMTAFIDRSGQILEKLAELEK